MERIPGIRDRLPFDSGSSNWHASKCSPKGIADEAADFAEGRGGYDEIISSLAEKVWDLCDDGCSMFRPLAICGAWGSGKTSFVTRLLYAMGEYNSALFFDPWMGGGQVGLVEQFFADLSRAIGCRSGVNFTAYAQAVVHVVSREASAAGVAGAGVLGGVAQGVGDALSGRKEVWSSLSEEKERICDELRRCSKRQIVVIDNLDRLPPSEIAMMFRLLGAVVNFPNVFYILLYDKKSVVQSLEIANNPGGAATSKPDDKGYDAALYLDKIVSFQIDMPPIDLDSVIRAEFGTFGPAVGDKNFRSALGVLVDTPRSALKLATNVRVAEAMGDGGRLANAPITETYLKIELPEFYRMAETAGDIQRLVDSVGRYPELFTRLAPSQEHLVGRERDSRSMGKGAHGTGDNMELEDDVMVRQMVKMNNRDVEDGSDIKKIVDGIWTRFFKVFLSSYSDPVENNDEEKYRDLIQKNDCNEIEHAKLIKTDDVSLQVSKCWLALRVAYLEQRCNAADFFHDYAHGISLPISD